jgi:hypothetical protein
MKQVAEFILFSVRADDERDSARDGIIKIAAVGLTDYVRQGLTAYDVCDEEVLRAVGILVARAMLEQHAYTNDIVSESAELCRPF